MPTFDVLSGTWYHITAPDLETAQKVYDAYWEDAAMPDGCEIKEGEVDSIWTPDLNGPLLTLEEFKDIMENVSHEPNQTTIDAMKEAME